MTRFTGSPPLVRERPPIGQAISWASRITPARAGKTSDRAGHFVGFQDHPRSCGKDLEPVSVVTPHQWITPARAGKTSRLFGALLSAGDHPRSCGKDKSPDAIDMASSGSPPLVRERLVRALGTIDRGGITPARAGKTLYLRCFRFSRRDHPRSCGKDPAARR